MAALVQLSTTAASSSDRFAPARVLLATLLLLAAAATLGCSGNDSGSKAAPNREIAIVSSGPCKQLPPTGAFQPKPTTPDLDPKLRAYAGAWEGTAQGGPTWLVVESVEATTFGAVYLYAANTGRLVGLVSDGVLVSGDRGPIRFRWQLDASGNAIVSERIENGTTTDTWTMQRCTLAAS